MSYRESIENIKKILPTNGSRPIIVTCDDMNDWVCKYDSTDKLLNEYLASSFLRLWGIPTPPIAFVNVHEEHIPDEMRATLQPRYFQKPCFGSMYLEHAYMLNTFFQSLKGNYHELSKIKNKEDFLKIALFDIWLSNEDRTQNNFNLLLNPNENGAFRFCAIDHSACFNTCSLEHGIYQLNLYDSIINSEEANVLFSSGEKLNQTVTSITDGFRISVNLCRERLNSILNELPESWNYNTLELENELLCIFEADWLNETERNFRQYVQEGIR